jgi:hypothetical protein
MKRVVIICSILALLALAAIPATSVHVTKMSFCRICGARKDESYSVHLGVHTPVIVIIQNHPLTQWFVDHGGHVHDWGFASGTSGSWMGRTIEDGRAPASLSLIPDLSDHFLTHADPKEIAAFAAIMQTGTEEDRKKAIAEMQDRELNRIEAE